MGGKVAQIPLQYAKIKSANKQLLLIKGYVFKAHGVGGA
jgi:hypothetical protein